MYSVPNHLAAAERARWLAELSTALEEALNLMPELILRRGRQADMMSLYSRLEAARAEILCLQSHDAGPQLFDLGPQWTHLASDLTEECNQVPCGRSPPPANASR